MATAANARASRRGPLHPHAACRWPNVRRPKCNVFLPNDTNRSLRRGKRLGSCVGCRRPRRLGPGCVLTRCSALSPPARFTKYWHWPKVRGRKTTTGRSRTHVLDDLPRHHGVQRVCVVAPGTKNSTAMIRRVTIRSWPYRLPKPIRLASEHTAGSRKARESTTRSRVFRATARRAAVRRREKNWLHAPLSHRAR